MINYMISTLICNLDPTYLLPMVSFICLIDQLGLIDQLALIDQLGHFDPRACLRP